MTREILIAKTKDEIFEFIRERLSFDTNIESQLRHTDKEIFKKEHRRFEMSGYENETGQCTKHNLEIVNKFADLGIYDYTSYMFLDFYKGHGTLYLKYFNDNENLEFELGGYGTTEIIYAIFEKTILTNRTQRRRI
ncbi:MAG: hypothetical protein J0M10_16310 [Chitinophagales bacterium]|nr:hypothetical protein [Chitinophagales bacterium]